MWGYNDEDGSALRKVAMRKRIRVEEFVFSEAAGCSRCSSGCHRMVLKPRAVCQFPCAIQHLWRGRGGVERGGGVGGHWKALLSKIVRDSSVVRLQSYGLDLKQVIRNGSWKQKKICGLWMHSYAMMRHQPWCVRLNVQRRWVTPLTGLLSAVRGWQWKVCIPPSACVPHNLLINFYNGGGRMQIIGVVNIWIKVLLFSQTRQHKNTLQPFHLHCTITHNEVSISYLSAAL